jgi:Flp pilus assembly protein TadD
MRHFKAAVVVALLAQCFQSYVFANEGLQATVRDCLTLVLSRGVGAVRWGNGFVIGDGSLVVTARHVVVEGSDEGEHELRGIVSVVSPYLGSVAYGEVVAADKDLDLTVLNVLWEKHPALTLIKEDSILSVEQVDVIAMPGLVRGSGQTSGRQIAESIDVQSERLAVDFVAVRRGKPRFIFLAKPEHLGDGWSGSPMLQANTSICVGCFTTLTTGTTRQARKQSLTGTGPVVTQVRRLLKHTKVESSLSPSQVSLPRPVDGMEVFLQIVAAYSCLAEKQYAQASEVAQKLTDLRPSDAVGYSVAASSARRLGKHSNAEKFFQQALAREPNDPALKFVYAKFLEGQGQSGEALELYEQLWRSGHNRSAAAIDMCNILASQGESAKGIEMLQKTLEDYPRNAYLWHSLGTFQTEKGQAEQGITSLTKAVELLPEFGPMRGTLAHTLEKAGRLDSAESHFRELLKIEPDNPVVHMWLAMFLARHRPSAQQEAMNQAKIALDLPPRGGLSRQVIEQFIHSLRSGTEQEPAK